jgi:hypothetical protein
MEGRTFRPSLSPIPSGHLLRKEGRSLRGAEKRDRRGASPSRMKVCHVTYVEMSRDGETSAPNRSHLTHRSLHWDSTA